MNKTESSFAILRPFLRGLPITVLIISIAWILAGRYLQYSTPMYESTARIKLADNHDGPSGSRMFKDFEVFANSNKLSAEVELIKSQVLIKKSLKYLNGPLTIYRVGDIHKTELYQQSPVLIEVAVNDPSCFDKTFKIQVSDSHIVLNSPFHERIEGHWNQAFQCQGARITISRNNKLLEQKPWLRVNDDYEFFVQSEQANIRQIISNLDVMSVDKEVPVIRISYKSEVPQKAADVVNAVAQAYINDYVQVKYLTADTTVDFLNSRLKEYSERLVGAENSIEDYRNNENIINIRQETETDLRKIADMKKQLANTEMNLLAIDSLNRYIEQGRGKFLELAPNFEAFTDLLSTEMVKKIKQLQGEKKDLLTRYTSGNEKVKVVDEKIEDLVSYLVESIRNTRTNLQIKYNDLQKNIAEAEAEFIGLPGKEKKMTILQRNFDLNEQIYRFLHEKRTEAEIAKAATISFHRIISPGEVPMKPVSPSASLLRALAVFLGLMVSVLLIYGVHFAKARVSDEQVIYRNSEIPLAMSVPCMKEKATADTFFERWALQMELKASLEIGALIVISSYARKEGKSYTAAALAEALGRQGKSVLLLDAVGTLLDERKSDMQYAGPFMESTKGFKYLFLADLFSIGRREELKEELKQWQQEFDVIIVRNACIHEAPMSLFIMSLAHSNLLLLDSRLTPSKRIVETDLLLQELSLPSVQFVLNRAAYNPSFIQELFSFFQQLLKGASANLAPLKKILTTP